MAVVDDKKIIFGMHKVGKIYPPKKQVLKDGLLCWSNVLPDHRNKSELVFSLICRIRNNLFHGGKFNGEWFSPQRSKELIEHALIILRTCGKSHSRGQFGYRKLLYA